MSVVPRFRLGVCAFALAAIVAPGPLALADEPAKAMAQPISSASASSPTSAWWTPLVPTSSPRGVGLVLTYASGGLALVTAGLSIGLEIDRADRARGHAISTCAVDDGTSLFCTELHARREQRNTMAGLAITLGGVAIGTGLVIALSDAFGPRSSAAIVAPLVGQNGGGLLVGGEW